MLPPLRRDLLARHLPPPDDRPVAGVECEYRLLDETGRPLDARVHLTPLLSGLPRLDPGDPRAVRLPIGSALTCDGWEAEAVTPPLPWGPSTGRDLTACIRATRSELVRLPWPGSVVVQGFSTHVNVSVPDRRAVAVARDLAHRCAPALSLLTEGPTGEGLLVRPRRGRVEVGCDHLDDEMVTPAVVLLAGLVELFRRRPSWRARLPRIDLAVRPAREKFGFYVARDAGGVDLVRAGRGATLRTRRGTRLSAGEHLERVWEAARPWAEAHGLPVAETDAVVGRAVPLPSEVAARPSWVAPTSVASAEVGAGRRWGVDLEPRVRAAGSVTVAWATWGATAFRCEPTGGTARFAVVPRTQHEGFLEALDSGRLDALLFRGRVARPGDTTPPRVADLVGAEGGDGGS